MPPVVRLLAKRLGTSLIVLIGVSMLIFAIARVIPGDPARIALGPNATADQIASLRAASCISNDRSSSNTAISSPNCCTAISASRSTPTAP